jgi:hypothetical protein
MSLVWIMVLLIYSTPAQSEDSCKSGRSDFLNQIQKIRDAMPACPSWIKERKGLPACPKSNPAAILPETYPSAVVFLNRNIETHESIIKKVVQILKESPAGRAPLIRIEGANDPEVMRDIRTLVKDQLRTSSKNVSQFSDLMEQIDVYVDGVSLPTSGPYLRDYFKSYVGSDQKLRVLSTNAKKLDLTYDLKIPNDCGLTVDDDPYDATQTELGGNLSRVSPHLCASTELTALHQKLGCTSENSVVLKSRSVVKHIDEYLMVVPDAESKTGCPKAVLLASPGLALDLIKESSKSHPEAEFFSLPFHRRRKPIDSSSPLNEEEQIEFKSSVQDRPSAMFVAKLFGYNGGQTPEWVGWNNMSGIKELCQAHFTGRAIHYKSCTGRLGCPSQSIPVDEWSESQIQSKIEELKKNYPVVSVKNYTKDPRNNKYCENLTIADVQGLLEKMGQVNEWKSIQNDIDQFKSDLMAKMKSKDPDCHPAYVSVPVYPINGIWGMPNSVNGVAVSPRSLLLPDPQIPIFKKSIEAQLKKEGVVPDWVDTLSINNLNYTELGMGPKRGNLHCATNSIPICSPK